MRAIVLTNLAAGIQTNQHVASVKRALQDAGIEYDMRPTIGFELGQATRSALESNPEVIIAAGGDGTISAVAGVLAGTPTPLGIIPLGTLNHFARDLGLPLDPSSAARVIAQGRVRTVDVGDVNGRCFINNASIGLYPAMVLRRQEQRQRLGRDKWVAMVLAAITVFRRCPVFEATLDTGSGTFCRMTPFIFVGNNRYEISLLSLRGRQRLDAGELSLYFANRTGRFALLVLMARALLGRLSQTRDFDAMIVPELRIESPKKSLRVACDGEVLRLHTPLHCRIRPAALRVFAPAR